MKLPDSTTTVGAAAAAILLLASTADARRHSHMNRHLEMLGKRHSHSHLRVHDLLMPREEPTSEAGPELQKRATCAFPTDAGLVAVTPGSSNGGWAIAPDQQCTSTRGYCPYACPPGKLMAQWDPSATTYTYPASRNGGLKCNSDGTVSKPFPDKPYCVDGAGSISAKNTCGGSVAFCQTVLPGDEDMLIPTNVITSATLAVPDTSYWAKTAAHYYINPPGTTTAQGCIWGDGSSAIGNWTPYVAGANTDDNGNTFVKIAWNPIYLEPATKFRNVLPKYGVKITCDGGSCVGLPCAIDPSTNAINQVTSALSASGAGGGDFCVVTVPKGSSANIVTFDVGGTSSGGDTGSASSSASDSSKGSSSSAASAPVVAAKVAPSSTAAPIPTTTSQPPPPPSTSAEPTTVSVPPTTSAAPPSTSSSESATTTSKSTTSTTSSAAPTLTVAPQILFENVTVTNTTSSRSSSASSTSLPVTLSSTNSVASIASQVASAPAAASSKINAGRKVEVNPGAWFALVVAVAALAWSA